MTPLRNPPPQRVPTLTEVVQLPEESPAAEVAAVAEAGMLTAESLLAAPVHTHAAAEADLAQRVLSDVQRQVDLMLEYRLREALGPVLARISEAVIREARDELASTLRDVVARAVAQEITRHRGR